MKRNCFVDITFDKPMNWKYHKNYLKNIAIKILSDHNIYISIFLTDSENIRKLNSKFRKKDYPTNVLAFPGEDTTLISLEDKHSDDFSEKSYLGEVILCWNVIKEEAQKYKFSFKKRCSHMLIHGILHLLGYDHHSVCDRMIMERIETSIMLDLNLGNPYEY